MSNGNTLVRLGGGGCRRVCFQDTLIYAIKFKLIFIWFYESLSVCKLAFLNPGNVASTEYMHFVYALRLFSLSFECIVRKPVASV